MCRVTILRVQIQSNAYQRAHTYIHGDTQLVWQIIVIHKLMARCDRKRPVSGRITWLCRPYVLNAHLTGASKTHTMPPALLSMQKIGQPSFSSDINLGDSNTHQRAIWCRTSFCWNQRCNWIEDEYRNGRMRVERKHVAWIWCPARENAFRECAGGTRG